MEQYKKPLIERLFYLQGRNVCHGRMDVQDTYRDVGGRVMQEQIPSDAVNSTRCKI